MGAYRPADFDTTLLIGAVMALCETPRVGVLDDGDLTSVVVDGVHTALGSTYWRADIIGAAKTIALGVTRHRAITDTRRQHVGVMPTLAGDKTGGTDDGD